MKILLLYLMSLILVGCYDASLAKAMAYMSSIVKQPLQKINQWDCPLCKEYKIQSPQAFTVDKSGLQGFLGYFPQRKAVVICFRPSSNIDNWITNLNYKKVRYDKCEGCKVHQGFYKAYNESAEAFKHILEKLLKNYDNSVGIIVTGHSLGGALGVLCSLDLKSSFNRNIQIYTFGQPRVGNKKFAQYFTNQIPQSYRVVYNYDAIAHMPPKMLGFNHGGKQIWYRKGDIKNYKQCQGQTSSCSRSVPIHKWNRKDHKISFYMQISAQNKSFFGNLRSVVEQQAYALTSFFETASKQPEDQIPQDLLQNDQETIQLNN